MSDDPAVCSWVLYDEHGNEAERCNEAADGELSFTPDNPADGDTVLVPFCAFHAALVDGVIL